MTTTTAKPTVDEVKQSMTGFDEMAIESTFGTHFNYLDGSMPGRALLFIVKRREGMSDMEARQWVLELPFGEVDKQFSIDEDVLDGDEPETEQGKDVPASE